MNNYVVSAHKPSAVTQTAVGNLFSTVERNLLVARNSRIDVYTFGKEGLVHSFEIPIYGRIAVMKLCRPPGESHDQLLILTAKYKLCILKWNTTTGEFETVAGADVRDKIGKPIDDPPIGTVDPQFRFFGLHLYERLLKVIPTDYSKESYNMMIGDSVEDVVFLHGCKVPTIALLQSPGVPCTGAPKPLCTVRAIEIPLDANAGDAAKPVWKVELQLDNATNLIAVPEPLGGVLVISEDTVTYLPRTNASQERKMIRLSSASPTQAVGKIDEDGSRYLLGDAHGELRLLILEREDDKVTRLKLEELGTTSLASDISYLDNGFVFIGSRFGDSQLIKLTREIDPNTNMNLQVMATYPNIGPIIDFCVTDVDRQGQKLVVTCSGGHKDGSLRVIRNGISVNEQASVELLGVKEMFSLKRNSDEQFHSFLVQSFTTETRVLEMVSAEEMQEAFIPGFDQTTPTLYASNMMASTIVQVTGKEVRLLRTADMSVVSTWFPPEGYRISIATGNHEQLLVATSGGNLISFEIENDVPQIVEKAHTKFDNEVSCLNCSPLGTATRSGLVAVGTWKDVTIRLLTLPDLQIVAQEELSGDTIARSLLFVSLDGMDILLVGAGDGHVFTYKLSKNLQSGQVLAEKRKISLGAQPASLTPFRNRSSTYVFAACDRPAVIHAAHGSQKLLCSNVNLREVTRVCAFDSEAFPDCLAITTEDSLIIGGVDDVQRLHIRSIPLTCQPRRITRVESTRCYAVLGEKAIEKGASPSSDMSMDQALSFWLRLYNDDFKLLDEFRLDKNELGMCLMTATPRTNPESSQEYIVVGTCYDHAALVTTETSSDAEAMRGRILVFTVLDSKLLLESELPMKGHVMCIKQFQDKVVAGVDARVVLLNWEEGKQGEMRLVGHCSHPGQALSIILDTQGDYILSGDVMKSMSLLTYDGVNILEDVARDFDQNWMRAVTIMNRENFLGAEDCTNFITVRWNSESPEEEERTRLERIGEYHLGDQVNLIRRGSLVVQLGESEGPVVRSFLFGTVSGMLGIIVQLKPEAWEFFHVVQEAMIQTVEGAGGLKHDEWRAFSIPRRTSNAKHFIDGDLVERFLDLDRQAMEKVARIAEVSVDELIKRVEEMARLH